MMQKRVFGLSTAIVSVFLMSCGDDSESSRDTGLGKGCNPDESQCQEGLECTATAGNADTYVCTIVAGGECDVDSEQENSGCATTAECTTNAEGTSSCTVRAGELCLPELDDGGCSDAAICVSVAADSNTEAAGAADAPEAEMRCLLDEGTECDPSDDLCAPEFTCAPMAAGGNRCFHRVVLEGTIVDSSNGEGISAGQVIAIDEEGVAVTDVALSGDDGRYSLELPVARNEDGSPVDAAFRLRAAAQEYQTFPSGIRVALPIDASTAEDGDDAYVIENALTELSLIALPAGERTTISGTVAGLKDGGHPVGGVLVVASSDDGAYSAITDGSGGFTIFNVPDGSYEIRGYAAELPLSTTNVSVDGTAVDGADLTELDTDTTRVTGSVSMVNAPGDALTSVILVVEDTFNSTAATGEVPRGLRAPRTGDPNVSGSFVIEGVPEGNYVVLAAYENDGLVRDPDTNIAGTDFVHLEVVAGAAASMAVPESFKVTEALAVIGPGADEPEAVDAAPTLTWADDSSEDWYEVRVFDALGNEVWSELELPGVSGQTEVDLHYEGPLDPGMYYQFRVTSWRQPGNGEAAPISTTEDLRGVFYLPAE